MARSGSLGKLTLSVIAEIGGFTAPLNKAQKNLSDFATKSQATLKAFGVAAIAAGTAVAGAYAFLARQSILAADEVQKTSQALGVNAEWLQTTRYAADLAGVSTEQFGMGLRDLGKRMAEAAKGGVSVQKLFDQIGVAVVDSNGKLRETEDVFDDIADAFSKYEDGAAKTELAVKLFAESGAKLIPLLNQGAAGINALRVEAEDLGLVMGENTRKAAERFNDSLTTLNRVKQGLINRTIPALLPLLNEVTGYLLDLSKQSKDSGKSLSEDLVSGFRVAASAAVAVSASTQILGRALGALAAAAASPRLAKSIFAELKADIAAIRGDAGIRIGDIMSGELGALGKAANTASTELKQLPVALEETTAAATVVRDTVGEAIAALQLQAATVGMSADETARYKLQLEGASGAQLAVVASLQGVISGYTAEQEALKLANDERKQRFELMLAEEERLDGLKDKHETYLTGISGETIRYRETMQELVELLNTGRISQDEFNAALGRAQTDMFPAVQEEMTVFGELAVHAAKNAQDAFASFLFDPFQGGVKDMLSSFVDAIRKMVAEALAAQIFGVLLGGAGGGGGVGLLGGLFGRASGGPVAGGTPYLVGERGPELFVPSSAGSVLPNNAMGGGMQMSQRIINVIDPAMVGDFMATPAGEKVLVNTIRRNSDIVRRATSG